VIKPVLVALFIGGSASRTYFMNQYGIVIDSSMVQNVIETDPVREANELLQLEDGADGNACWASLPVAAGMVPARLSFRHRCGATCCVKLGIGRRVADCRWPACC
jgi:glucan phosphoethanolaminetransferase (alkaline phosphatase superfamily)